MCLAQGPQRSEAPTCGPSVSSQALYGRVWKPWLRRATAPEIYFSSLSTKSCNSIFFALSSANSIIANEKKTLVFQK